MTGWLGAAYPWVLAAHIIFVIFWVAALFTFTRNLGYQAATASGSAEDRLWVERIGLLSRVVATPAMLASWLLGLALSLHLGFAGNLWLHVKLLLVLLLTGFHGWLVGQARRMRSGRPTREVTFKRLSELPAIMTVFIVILVAVKPF
jgi:putative membrane protein